MQHRQERLLGEGVFLWRFGSAKEKTLTQDGCVPGFPACQQPATCSALSMLSSHSSLGMFMGAPEPLSVLQPGEGSKEESWCPELGEPLESRGEAEKGQTGQKSDDVVS